MDLFLEIIFEIVIEGSLALGTSRKVPLPLRILALFIFALIYGAIVTLFAIIARDCWIDGNIVAAILLMGFDVFFAWVVVWKIWHVYRSKKR